LHLIEGPKLIHAFPRKHILAASIVGAFVLLALIFDSSGQVNATRTSIPIALELSDKHLTPLTDESLYRTPPINEPKQVTKPTPSWDNFTIKEGHNLSNLFSMAGFNDKIMYRVLGKKKANKKLTNIFPGETLSFLKNEDNKLSKIKHTKSKIESVIYSQNDSGVFISEIVTRKPEIHISYASGEITSSLFLACQRAGLTEAQTMELANIFGWDIDFILDIRSGDTFNLIYEELHLDGEKYKNGKILAANFKNQKRDLSAVLFKQDDGTTNYFTPDGKSMRKAFLRTPVDFARISSHFNLKRKHPILHKIRAHKGTDYAANRGTPIKATGDGKVIHSSRKGGYGKTVIIQHGQKFTTLYAHMSKYAKGVRVGKRVKQGQTIGYIGSTGLASGPHLHYEFRVNGVHKNSLKVKLPHAKPIPKKQLARFEQDTRIYLAQLETFNTNIQLAINP